MSRAPIDGVASWVSTIIGGDYGPPKGLEQLAGALANEPDLWGAILRLDGLGALNAIRAVVARLHGADEAKWPGSLATSLRALALTTLPPEEFKKFVARVQGRDST